MLAEAFASGTTCIHRLDPRVRIVAALFFSVFTAVARSYAVLGGAFSAAVILVLLARLDAKTLMRRLLTLNIFVLVVWLVVPFTYQGESVFAVGMFAASRQGIAVAAKITLKANAIFLAFSSLVSTMPLVTLGHALQHLAVPPKLVHLLLFTYRYIHVIEREYRRLFKAIQIRCFKPGVNRHTYRTYAYLVGMLLVKSFSRSSRVYEAMICRGFKGRLYSMHRFRITAVDLCFLGLMVFLVSGLAYCEWL